MNVSVFAFIFCFLTICSPLNAKVVEKIECKAKLWPYDKNLPIRNISTTLNKLSRSQVVQLAWGEVTKKNQSDSVAMPLLQFLAGTETDDKARGYFKSLSMLMTNGRLPDENITAWPKRVPATPISYSQKTLCDQYWLTQNK